MSQGRVARGAEREGEPAAAKGAARVAARAVSRAAASVPVAKGAAEKQHVVGRRQEAVAGNAVAAKEKAAATQGPRVVFCFAPNPSATGTEVA